MKRRLNIACSLLSRPQVVLLDEPTAGVDPQSRERIYEMLAGLRRSGVSIVLTTHHLEEAERRCDRIVIIDHGRIVASGTLRELLGRTLGSGRALTVTLQAPLPDGGQVPPAVTLDENRRQVRALVDDVGRDVPALLHAILESGGRIQDFELTGGTLQDAFIALTGRELRE
jgi:ABC-2 type transport system ATP-binding protein